MLAFFIPDSISALASRTKELAMDATFSTNNTGADLFAVRSGRAAIAKRRDLLNYLKSA
jgi:hypothetical protein